MRNTWILIANASEASIYDLDHEQFVKGKIKLKLVDNHSHPDSRKKTNELVSDRLGRYRARKATRGAFVPDTEPKEHEAEVFAIELASKLNHHRSVNQFQQLILIVPAHFLGVLNKHLDKHVSQMVSEIIEKDYTKIPSRQLLKYMQDHLLN